MTDLALVFDYATGTFDYTMRGSQLVLDDGISTAVILSWFVNKRALPGDVLPQEQPGPFGLNTRSGGDRMGTWIDFMTPPNVNILPGQPYPEPTDRMGSWFWLYKHRKMTASLPAEMASVGYDCLNWMLRDGVASTIEIKARALGKQTILMRGQIQLANGSPVSFLLPTIVGGGSWPLPPEVTSGQNGALGVFVLDRDILS